MHILTRVPDKTKSLRIRGVAVALSIALGSLGVVCSTQRSVKDENVSGTVSSSKRMPDGKQWTTENLKVDTAGTYCFDDAEQNCRRYGRSYTWESAQQGCQSLGDGWRLPTDDESRQLAKHHGGVREDSDDGAKAAYYNFGRGGLALNRQPEGPQADGRLGAVYQGMSYSEISNGYRPGPIMKRSVRRDLFWPSYRYRNHHKNCPP